MPRSRKSISFPIAVGVVSVSLSVALLVGWILIVANALSQAEQVASPTWLLVLGCISFVVIITTLVLFSVFLAREIRVVNRQTRFIDSVTHELKSPLASLKLCLQTQERTSLSAEHQRELHQMMVDDVTRLSNLIDDVLEASRLSTRRIQHAAEPVDLQHLIATQTAEVIRYHKLPRTAFRSSIPEGLTLVTDRIAFGTVVRNILDNAVKYSRDLEHPVDVRVSAIRVANRIDLEVEDNGIGIPSRELSRIFQRFYRVPEEAVMRQHGTGLGLYVASSLLRQLGGSVRADSVPGEGTTMHIRIPVQPRRSMRVRPQDEPAGAAEAVS